MSDIEVNEIQDGDPMESVAPDEKKSYETFDEFLATQDQPVQELYKSHTNGLRSALVKEREEKKALVNQIRNLQTKAEKGSEMEKQLSDMAAKLEEANRISAEAIRKAEFTEQALSPEVGCLNVKAAYALAKAEDLFDKNSHPDWEELKKQAPELFKQKTRVSTDAGRDTIKTTGTMNEILRSAAGIK